MRFGGRRDFVKLYGKIDQSIPAGSTIRVMVTNLYPLELFDGSKHVGLMTMGPLGAPNTFLGVVLLITGGLCILCFVIALVFTVVRGKTWKENMIALDKPENQEW